jgi:hypothetical protein
MDGGAKGGEMSRTFLSLSALVGFAIAATLASGGAADAHARKLHFFGTKSVEYYGSHGNYRVCKNIIVDYIPYWRRHKTKYWPVYGKRCRWLRTW